ncbi:hypothetical protein [Mucilaginibacter sp. PPCGB 2223]|uniref:hypothetical protein n=1 Tax=Mucilaginibacter sp. PPCGB 2223 TaxID=1886027 RepID=UPI0015862B68|nr:hypothetical protein [Mucilaginibacter sp. PPCGB 2223]
MRTDKIFLLIRVTVRTEYQHIHDAIQELQKETDYHIGSTENVEVLETEIMDYKLKN